MENMGTVVGLKEKFNSFTFDKYKNNGNNRSLLSTVAEIFTISNGHASSL